MSLAPVEHVFTDAQAQALALADAVGAQLRAGIAARGAAWIAVPGGETPRRFLAALARQDLDWPRVCVFLTDERQVPEDDARSNSRLLRECLLDRAPARFVPLASMRGGASDSPELPHTFDAVVLGMGADGHCASLFADGDAIAAALAAAAPPGVVALRSPSVPEPRITLTLSALVDTRALYLLIRGEDKRRALAGAQRAQAPFAQAPIRRVLENAPVAPQIYWCP